MTDLKGDGEELELPCPLQLSKRPPSRELAHIVLHAHMLLELLILEVECLLLCLAGV
jgi:hypothetical protein